MAFRTAQDIVNEICNLLGLTSILAGEAPAAAISVACLNTLNLMLDEMSIFRQLQTALTRENFPLSANASSYSIGTGQTFNTAMPLKIVDAFYRDASSNDLPIYPYGIMARDEWDLLPDKATATGSPQGLYYDPGVTQQASRTGTINIYPIPDQTYTLFIDSEKMFTEFANLSSTYNFPLAYQTAITYNGAKRFGSKVGRSLSEADDKIARDSLDEIRNLNFTKLLLKCDLPGTRNQGGANILDFSGAN